MKTIIFFILFILVCASILAQNITNTLGASGLFSIKDGSTTYLSVNQSTGYLSLNRSLTLSNTTSSTTGVIFKGIDRFLHNYGFANTFLGINSGNFTMTGALNTAVGVQSLFSNTTGNYNTALGVSAGYNISTGDNNIAMGLLSQVPSNTGSNQVRIGDANITYAGIQVAWTITSDRRWKRNILPSNLGLGFISKLKPVSYTRINDEKQKTEYGLIAQEIEEVLNEEGIENSAMITVTDEGNYELRYNDLFAPMIKAIQELNEENQNLKIKNQNLEERLAKNEQQQEILFKKIEQLESKENVLNISNGK